MGGWSARSRTGQEAQFAGKCLSEKEKEHKKHVGEACLQGGGRWDARRMARGLLNGAAGGRGDASEKPISKSDSILGTDGRTDGDGGTRQAACPPKSRRASSRPPLCIAPIQPIRCPLLRA